MSKNKFNHFKKYNFPHGIMFHHFHDNKNHKKSFGSINKSSFEKIIKFLGKKKILTPNEFIQKYNYKKKQKNFTCFTFDDSLKCQLDIAVPIMNQYNIKGFFFYLHRLFQRK